MFQGESRDGKLLFGSTLLITLCRTCSVGLCRFLQAGRQPHQPDGGCRHHVYIATVLAEPSICCYAASCSMSSWVPAHVIVLAVQTHDESNFCSFNEHSAFRFFLAGSENFGLFIDYIQPTLWVYLCSHAIHCYQTSYLSMLRCSRTQRGYYSLRRLLCLLSFYLFV